MLLIPVKHSSSLFPVCCIHFLVHLQNPCGLSLNQDHVKDGSEGIYEESERRTQRSGLPCSPYTNGYQGQRGRCRKGPLLEFKGLAKFYRTARCDLENPTERVGMPSIGKLWQGKKQTVSNWMRAMSGKSLWQLSAWLNISTRGWAIAKICFSQTLKAICTAWVPFGVRIASLPPC